jgi:hypothetical protein
VERHERTVAGLAFSSFFSVSHVMFLVVFCTGWWLHVLHGER